ncbi:HNH endonuclease signature motif containing protein [Catellatospora aurea]|uniref:HNH endonuclease signature motif containing protein n=1 Tax=Catellatospora aurea TaxID=1337874 RepID=A0ABW2H4Z1_9ACTN
MAQGRPDIPVPLQREVLVEAGHRCAIPTCRTHPVEIAHIVPWAKVRVHEMVNLIALCPTCHTRYDRGEIDRKAMQKYKQNLSMINSLYSSLERRVLEHFAIRRDIQIKLAFPLAMREMLGVEEFNALVRRDFQEQAERIFDVIETQEAANEDEITLAAGNRLLLWQLTRDGYLLPVPGSAVFVENIPVLETFKLTDEGKEFLDRWITADYLNLKEQEQECDCHAGKAFAYHMRNCIPESRMDAVARAVRAEIREEMRGA